MRDAHLSDDETVAKMGHPAVVAMHNGWSGSAALVGARTYQRRWRRAVEGRGQRKGARKSDGRWG